MKFKTSDFIFGSLIISFGVLISGLNITQESRNETFDITYSVPQLERFIPSFLLRDRKVMFFGLEKARKPMSKKTLPQPKENKQESSPKKVAKNEANKKKSESLKKHGLTVDTVAEKQGDEDLTPSPEIAGNPNQPGFIGAGIAKKSGNTSEIAEALMTNPNRELMNEWIRLFRNKNITKVEFYSVLADMAESGSTRLIEVSIYGMAATPSFESFSQLAVISEILEQPYKKIAQSHLVTYSEYQYIGVLESALSAQDPIVVRNAARLTVASAKKTQKRMALRLPTNNGTENVRALRGEPSLINPKIYDRIIDLLQEATRSSNSEVSQIASESLQSIARLISG